MMNASLPKALTIAGSDSGGGAGIQADLRTFHALGVYGMSALTAVTAQNTVGVSGVWALPPEAVEAQLEAVLSDIGAGAAKTGMLANAAIIEGVVRALDRRPIANLVVDPVMIATSGDSLLEPAAVELYRTLLIPRARLVTPNMPEAEALTGLRVLSMDEMRAAAEKLVAMGAGAALVKGGHLEGNRADDVFFDGREHRILEGQRVAGIITHGSGCTLSAAIAAYLARGEELCEAIAKAKAFVQRAIETAIPVGTGGVPLNHFAKPA